MDRGRAVSLGRTLNWAATGISVLFFFHRRWYTLVLCLGSMIAALVAVGLWPENFTVAHPRKDPKRPHRKKTKQTELDLPILLPGLALGLTMNRTLLDGKPVFFLAGAGTVLLALGLLRIPEFRRDLRRLLCGLVIGFLLLMAVVCQINVLFDFDAPETVQAQVTDVRVLDRARRADDYFCTVSLPEGEVEIGISRGTYHQISPGDTVYYHYSVGVLGIPYGQITLTNG